MCAAGDKRGPGGLAGELQKVELTVWTNAECSKIWGKLCASWSAIDEDSPSLGSACAASGNVTIDERCVRNYIFGHLHYKYFFLLLAWNFVHLAMERDRAKETPEDPCLCQKIIGKH